jgi:hypothetical protein
MENQLLSQFDAPMPQAVLEETKGKAEPEISSSVRRKISVKAQSKYASRAEQDLLAQLTVPVETAASPAASRVEATASPATSRPGIAQRRTPSITGNSKYVSQTEKDLLAQFDQYSTPTNRRRVSNQSNTSTDRYTARPRLGSEASNTGSEAPRSAEPRRTSAFNASHEKQSSLFGKNQVDEDLEEVEVGTME